MAQEATNWETQHQRRLLLLGSVLLGLWSIVSAALSNLLEEALQSGDLRLWRAVFATPPPDAEWLAALRASPIYWLLSPMTWFWLLLIWPRFAYGNRVWRLSKFGSLGLLALIFALPIGWLSY